MAGVGVEVTGAAVCAHPCTYVVGKRLQRWALLGGEIPGLSGETAMSVRLYIPHSTTTSTTATTKSSTAISTIGVGEGANVNDEKKGAASSSEQLEEQNSVLHTATDYAVPPIGKRNLL
jgi:hypothetical protein